MKQTFAFIFAAMMLLFVASCQKTEQPSDPDVERTIELTFENNDSTYDAASGQKPQWEAGDKIWFTNGTDDPVEVTLDANDIHDNKATIKTKLSGTLHAVYPAVAQNGYNDGKIGFKIPTRTDGSFKKAYIAVAEGTTSLVFKNVVSILKFGLTPTTKIIRIVSPSEIAGEFKVTYSTLAIEAGAKQAKGVTVISPSDGDRYVAVASGVAIKALNFTVAKNAMIWGSKKFKQEDTTTVSSIHNLGSTVNWNITYSSGNSTWATFSVAADKQIRFSKGNMYYDGNGFKFEGSQHSTTPSKNGEYSSDHISHFYWSKTASVATAQSYSESEVDKSDIFFTNATATTPKSDFTVNGETGIWRTLSPDEWKYLLNTNDAASGARTDSQRYAKAMVNGVKGLLVFPDGFSEEINSTGVASINSNNYPFPTESIYIETWLSIESAGAVFLPAAGYRKENKISNYGVSGYYWSSPVIMYDYSYSMVFDEYDIIQNGYEKRSLGSSVRLISDVK